MLNQTFFARDPQLVAQDLLGKLIYVHQRNLWLCAMIIETEAYYIHEKGSHASLGFTEKRKALFMPPGTIYMYYSRGGDSLNISCEGEGNAVLIKSGLACGSRRVIERMTENFLQKPGSKPKPPQRLCSGQTLLCRALGLKVPEWNQKQFDPQRFYFSENDYKPTRIIQTTRLGIPPGRDEHLHYRFLDYAHAASCTQNPLTKRGWREGKDYFILENRFL